MRKLSGVLAVFILFISNSTALADAKKILVKFKNEPNLHAVNLFNSLGAKHVSAFKIIPSLFEVTVSKDQNVHSLLAYLKTNPSVEYAELDHKVFAVEEPPFPWPWDPGDGNGDLPFPWPFPDPTPPPPAKDPELILDPAPINEPSPDPDFSKTWGLAKIEAEKAWKLALGNHDVIVSVIDTGVDYNHEDLALNMWRNVGESGSYEDPKTQEMKRKETDGVDNDGNGFIDDVVGWDFVNNDSLPYDDYGHGTHVSGTIGAVGNNGKGTVGVNHIASIMGVKFLDASGSGDLSNGIKSIEYAINNGARVLSNSWGDYEYSEALKDVITKAQEKDVIFVAAAGNESKNNDGQSRLYPASFENENIISVAASNEQDRKAFFSNYGKKSVDLAAPGTQIYSTTPNNKYENFDGTSMATPHVAGAAALLLSIDKNLSYTDVKNILLTTVDKLSQWKEKTVTGGRLNLYNAVKKVMN